MVFESPADGSQLWKTSSGAAENVLEGNPRSDTAGRALVELWVNYFYDSFIQTVCILCSSSTLGYMNSFT